jgi:hypothetical protein
MRAGIRRYAEVHEVTDLAGEPARASYLTTLEGSWSRFERARFFAVHALIETLALVQVRGPLAVPVYLALPELSQDPDAAGMADKLPQALTEALRDDRRPIVLTFDPTQSFARGAVAGFWALRAALQAIERGAKMALVGAADSLSDPQSVRRWADDNRLLGQRNGDGTLPGEGSAFMLLVAPHMLAASALATVQAVAVAEQPPFERHVPATGSSLTTVFHDLRQQTAGRVDEVVSAQPERTLWGREFSYACLRNAELMPEPLRHVSVGAALGEAGAAAAVMAMVRAVAGLKSGLSPLACARHRQALVYGLSESGGVGGTVLRATEGETSP